MFNTDHNAFAALKHPSDSRTGAWRPRNATAFPDAPTEDRIAMASFSVRTLRSRRRHRGEPKIMTIANASALRKADGDASLKPLGNLNLIIFFATCPVTPSRKKIGMP